MAESAWKKQLQDFGVEEDVIAAIITLGFKRDATFVNAIIDSDALEGWLKRLKAKVASACVLPDDEMAFIGHVWQSSRSVEAFVAFAFTFGGHTTCKGASGFFGFDAIWDPKQIGCG